MSGNSAEQRCLEKISASRFFTSEKDVELLRYLLKSTKESKSLKETIIAIEFFGRDASFDPGSDSIVRSSIYNLRKKLESYYLHEGAQDPLRFVIPKGRYLVKIEKGVQEKINENRNDRKSNISSPRVILIISLSLTLIFALLYFRDRQKEKAEKGSQAGPVWDYYLESENPLLLVFGDYFMLQEAELYDSTYSFIRKPEINNQADYFSYLDSHPEQRNKLKKLGQSYFGEEIPKCLMQISQIFQNAGKEIKVKYASELSLDDVRENDLIFLGDYVTLGTLKPFFEETGFRYEVNPNALYLLNEQKDTTDFFLLDNPEQSVFQNDYATITSTISYPGKRILFVLSFLPFGKSEALYKLQESTFIHTLSDSLAVLPPEWSLVLKTSGLQSSGFYIEVEKFLIEP